MTFAYWAVLATAILLAVALAWVDYRAADKLRAAQEERDEALLEAVRQTAMAEAWHAIAEGTRAMTDIIERGWR